MTHVIANLQSDETDGIEVIERSQVAGEIGAAIAHQLSEPLTALLLYLSELRTMSGQFAPSSERGASPRDIIEGAIREAERACMLVRRIGDVGAVPLPEQAAIKHGRNVIAWWSRTTAMAAVAEDMSAREEMNSRHQLLTRREREVLRLVREGLTSKEGAIRLLIGPRTFESHRARIMKKLKARNAADLVRMSLQAEAGAGRPK